MIESALAQYHVNMGGLDTITSTNNGDLSADGHSITDLTHAEGLPDEIVHWFDAGVPGCPIDGNTYTVTRIDETVIKIECVGDEGHGEFRH
jgi:hypothetical protein